MLLETVTNQESVCVHPLWCLGSFRGTRDRRQKVPSSQRKRWSLCCHHQPPTAEPLKNNNPDCVILWELHQPRLTTESADHPSFSFMRTLKSRGPLGDPRNWPIKQGVARRASLLSRSPWVAYGRGLNGRQRSSWLYYISIVNTHSHNSHILKTL